MRRHHFAAGASSFLLGAIFSCSGGEDLIFRDTSILLGTYVEVTVAGQPEARAREAIAAALDEIRRVEGLTSSFIPESAVSLVNREAAGRPVPLDPEVFDLIRRSVALGAASGGAFDITVQPLVALWSFESGGTLPAAGPLQEAVGKVGYDGLVLDHANRSVGLRAPGMGIDLGAIGAGWAADVAMARLQALGVTRAIVDAGGEIRVLGTRPDGSPWRIGVRHPREEGRLLMTLGLTDTAIATSGDYERFFEQDGVRYHHILDPSTGMPARGCRSVTVLAPTATEADALSTAAFVMGPERGLAFLRSRPGVRGFIVDAQGSLHWTDAGLRSAALQ